ATTGSCWTGSTRSPSYGAERSAGTAATSPTTRRPSPWSKKRPNARCGRPRPACGGRNASWSRPGPSWTGGAGAGARRRRAGGGVPRIVAGTLKRRAQISAGKLRGTQLDRLDEASKRLADAEEALRDDAEIRVDLPETSVPAGRGVLTLSALEARYGARAELI